MINDHKKCDSFHLELLSGKEINREKRLADKVREIKINNNN